MGGKINGLQRWQVTDGQEAGDRIPMDVNALSVSRDGKWILCGTTRGASVWDAKPREKAIEVEGTVYVGAVDISSDSTRFATASSAGGGEGDNNASIWNIITGERLIGPLQHVNIAGIKFSPNGEHIASAVEERSILAFDSHNGDQLCTIKTDIPIWSPVDSPCVVE